MIVLWMEAQEGLHGPMYLQYHPKVREVPVNHQLPLTEWVVLRPYVRNADASQV